MGRRSGIHQWHLGEHRAYRRTDPNSKRATSCKWAEPYSKSASDMTVLRSGSASDTGLVRSTNQDLALETSSLFAVADGMGGHAGGEVASRLAIDALTAAFGRQPTGLRLGRSRLSANAAVWAHSQENADLRGMGTTLTAVALVDEGGHDVLALVNVGDSRSYRFHDGELTQITTDHSLAEEMVLSGELTPAEAACPPPPPHPHPSPGRLARRRRRRVADPPDSRASASCSAATA